MSDRERPYDLLMEFFEKYGKDMDVRSFEIKWCTDNGYYYSRTIKVGGYDTYDWCDRNKKWFKSGGLDY